MEKNKDAIDNGLYQKELEDRVEKLQTLLNKECEDHAADNKKYALAFHQFMKDLHKVAKITDYMQREVKDNEEERNCTGAVGIDKKVLVNMIEDLNKIHDKYSDKSYAFLKEIIRNE
jgi:uncharacterized UPF0160 family protein